MRKMSWEAGTLVSLLVCFLLFVLMYWLGVSSKGYDHEVAAKMAFVYASFMWVPLHLLIAE